MSNLNASVANLVNDHYMVFVQYDDPLVDQYLNEYGVKIKSDQNLQEFVLERSLRSEIDKYFGQEQDEIFDEVNELLESFIEPDFQLVQEFEGYVDEVFDKTFLVVLKDLAVGDENEPEDIGEFDLSLLSTSDRERIAEGSEIRWQVGYTFDANENKKAAFNLTLCPPQTYTKEEHLEAMAEAERINEGLKKHESSQKR